MVLVPTSLLTSGDSGIHIPYMVLLLCAYTTDRNGSLNQLTEG